MSVFDDVSTDALGRRRRRSRVWLNVDALFFFAFMG